MAHISEREKEKSRDIFEGIISVRAVIEASENHFSDRKIKELFLTDERAAKYSKEAAWLTAKSKEFGFAIERISCSELDALTISSTHGGIAARCTERTLAPLSPENIEAASSGFFVMIEGIEDPYNFGYAIRSLYAAGVDGIVINPKSNRMTSAGIVCRASAGASEAIPMYICDPEIAAEMFESKKYKVVCADLRDSVSAFDADLKLPLFLIVGGEKRGISRSLLDMAHTRVRIDYGRDFAASLSSASAASILAFEIFRQNR